MGIKKEGLAVYIYTSPVPCYSVATNSPETDKKTALLIKIAHFERKSVDLWG